MVIHQRPKTLKHLLALGLFIFPLIALNIAVFEKTSLVKAMAQAKNLRIYAWLAGWSLISLYFTFRGRWVGFWSSGVLSGLLLYGNIYFLFTYKNYGLAFFALGLLILTTFYHINLYQLLSKHYFDDGRAWYEHFPRCLPHMHATITGESQDAAVRIYSIGTDGCFLYSNKTSIIPNKISLFLDSSPQDVVECKVKLVSKTKDGIGMGLMFTDINSDLEKDLNDFIDKAKSYGYVN